eukprot:1854549-Prymnesium_polylepis.1
MERGIHGGIVSHFARSLWHRQQARRPTGKGDVVHHLQCGVPRSPAAFEQPGARAAQPSPALER